VKKILLAPLVLVGAVLVGLAAMVASVPTLFHLVEIFTGDRDHD
jgi:threonine/homoserine/homoserine lactone efflux protein